MKTDELIALLAAGEGPTRRGLVARRLAIALGCGGGASFLLMAAALGINPNLPQVALLPMFTAKITFVAALAAASLLATRRLSVPGWLPGRVPEALAATVLAMWLAGAFAWLSAEPDRRMDLVLGQTWLVCAPRIAMLSLPVFAALLWAMRGLAPTRLRLAGAAAGLLSGATGALAYAIHCPELAAPFLGIWYVIGMVAPAAVGALIGPRVLRW